LTTTFSAEAAAAAAAMAVARAEVAADANAVVAVVAEGARVRGEMEEEVVTAEAAAEAVERTAVVTVERSDAAARNWSGALLSTRSDIVKELFICEKWV
jgi:hypothetical protein